MGQLLSEELFDRVLAVQVADTVRKDKLDSLSQALIESCHDGLWLAADLLFLVQKKWLLALLIINCRWDNCGGDICLLKVE